MSINPECIYCTRDERQANLMIEIVPLRVSTLFLFKEQTYKGRCVVALNEHEREFFHLSQEKQDAYMRDVAQTAKAIEQAFSPDKINYGAFGDTMPHVHFHVVPKYKDGAAWGKMFEMNPGEVILSEAEYEQLIAQIKKHL
ncbi:HIT family protein [Paenibacillus thalictri]|uniref:HIT family protein n=1 Tax=Paenibacillus thalictri TaxID=2527873 RepID=A0A4Q9DVG8_9BACL|nr:HIT family protein [Paenibacillus thalictri]TBL80274.1 HIT family protein [Paenibacillus thalictri]